LSFHGNVRLIKVFLSVLIVEAIRLYDLKQKTVIISRDRTDRGF